MPGISAINLNKQYKEYGWLNPGEPIKDVV